LTDHGLKSKLLIRKDGTSVYITQDLGTAQLRNNDFNPEKLLYVVGNEQNYHFNILKLILKKINKKWVDSIYHLSYGMVNLPEGKMKSREGNVVDADDLIKEMIDIARKTTEQLGKIENFTKKQAEKLYNIIGIGALKYFILKVDPKKNMLFNPEESIDFDGNTAPFIQYTYARIQSVLRKANYDYNVLTPLKNELLLPKEKQLIKLIYEFSDIISMAAETYSPAIIANYVYELAKQYNQFYHDITILKEKNNDISAFRIMLSKFTGNVIKSCMKLMGIDVPDKM
jgi:arginyl-tRNA synthetase